MTMAERSRSQTNFMLKFYVKTFQKLKFQNHMMVFNLVHVQSDDRYGSNPYLKFPKDSVQLRITTKKILCGVLGHLL